MQWSPRSSMSPPYPPHGSSRVPIIDLSDEQDSSSEVQPRRRLGPQNCRRFWGLACSISAVAGVVLGGMLAVGTAVSNRASARGSISVVDMLEGRQLAEVVSGNLAAAASYARLGRRLAEPAISADEVQAGLRQVSGSIMQRSPDIHRQLQECRLTPEQQDGLLRLMAHTRDERVQNLGRRLVDGLDDSGSSASLAEDMSARLKGQLSEVLVLRQEVIPQELLQSREAPGGWPAGALPEEMLANSANTAAVDPERMRLVRNFKKWRMEFDVSAPQIDTRIQDRRLQEMHEGMSASLKAIEQQAGLYVGRAESYIKSFPKVHDVLFGQDYYKTFKQCAGQAYGEKDMGGLYKCCTTYASAAMEAMEGVVRSKAKGMVYGPTAPAPAPSSWLNMLAPAPTPAPPSGLMGMPGFDMFR